VAVTNGRLEGIQEGIKGINAKRHVGRSNIQEEKHPRRKTATIEMCKKLRQTT